MAIQPELSAPVSRKQPKHAHSKSVERVSYLLNIVLLMSRFRQEQVVSRLVDHSIRPQLLKPHLRCHIQKTNEHSTVLPAVLC